MQINSVVTYGVHIWHIGSCALQEYIKFVRQNSPWELALEMHLHVYYYVLYFSFVLQVLSFASVFVNELQDLLSLLGAVQSLCAPKGEGVHRAKYT